MKIKIITLFTSFALVSGSFGAVVYFDDPNNYVTDNYWPDLPSASNMGGATYLAFVGMRQGSYLTSDLTGENARLALYNYYLPSGQSSPWRLELLANESGEIDRLNIGDIVGENGLWISNLTTSANDPHQETPFESDLSRYVSETMYIGFRQANEITGEFRYGWAEIKTVPMRDDDSEDSWAYFNESSAGIKFTRNAFEENGGSILVGQTVSVPEPCVMMLAAFATLPLLVSRRR